MMKNFSHRLHKFYRMYLAGTVLTGWKNKCLVVSFKGPCIACPCCGSLQPSSNSYTCLAIAFGSRLRVLAQLRYLVSSETGCIRNPAYRDSEREKKTRVAASSVECYLSIQHIGISRTSGIFEPTGSLVDLFLRRGRCYFCS